MPGTDAHHLQVRDAYLRLRFAQAYVKELEEEQARYGPLPAPDGRFQLEVARAAERRALAAYHDLVVAYGIQFKLERDRSRGESA